MSARLQKLQKIRLPSTTTKFEPQLHPQMNQTIIINNPNININYMNDSSRTNGPLSSRGLDNWHLNNNLKEFSQTRQLGFFKSKKERNKSNSPYTIHKVRTQDIRSINKVYAPSHHHQQAKDTQSHFRKNQTISHIQPYNVETEKQGQMNNTIEKNMNRRDKTITEKFYQGQIRKNMRIDLQKNRQTLPTSHLANPEHHLPQTHTNPKSFRRGRFELPEKVVTPISNHREPSKESSEGVSSPEKCLRCQKEQRQIDSAESQTKDTGRPPVRVPIELRKRVFNRTISKIDQLFLGSTDEYFLRSHRQTVPQSQIQLCVNSLNHPQHISPSKDRSLQRQFNSCRQYDFQFEQQRKKRPKTPRRKKFYDMQD